MLTDKPDAPLSPEEMASVTRSLYQAIDAYPITLGELLVALGEAILLKEREQHHLPYLFPRAQRR